MKRGNLLLTGFLITVLCYACFHYGRYYEHNLEPRRSAALMREIVVRDSCYRIILADMKQQLNQARQ